MTDQLHYRGGCTGFDPEHVMGPDMFGANYRATAAEYDLESDRTTLTLVPIPPDQLQQRMLADFAKLGADYQISTLFGGRI
jgi:hypothetical protein